MPLLPYDYFQVAGDPALHGLGAVFTGVDKAVFDAFTPTVLGLGDVARDGEYVQALAAIFDLEGFTDFCGQNDSHLVIPEFLSRYLHWLFATLAEQLRVDETESSVRLWARMPFYAKFLGDGLLFLWRADCCHGSVENVNIARSLLVVTNAYVQTFLPEIRKAVSNPPARLRCGLAVGQVISIGGGADFVGPCINEAARLQKLCRLSFAMMRRGFDLSQEPESESALRRLLTLKCTSIRSVGERRLVYIRNDEFGALSADEQRLFTEP